MQQQQHQQGSRGRGAAALGNQSSSPYTTPHPQTPGTYAQASTSSNAATTPAVRDSNQAGGSGTGSGPPPGLPNGAGSQLRNEDFPALGGMAGMAGIMGMQGGNAQEKTTAKLTSPSPPPSNLVSQHPPPSNPASQLTPSASLPTSNGTAVANSTTSPFPHHMTASPSSFPAQASNEPLTKPIQQITQSPVDAWGLAALVQLIRTGGNGEQLALTLGEDLARIGLDMTSSAPLYPSFVAPWAEPDQLRGVYLEEEYRIPQCYNVNTPPLNKHKLTLLSDETLFYAFYSSPGDVMQIQAAHELYSRQWRYHKQLGVWLTKEPGVEPIEKGHDYERGTYIIFDPNQFTRVETSKDFHLIYDLLEDRPAFMADATQAATNPGGAQPQSHLTAPPSSQQPSTEQSQQTVTAGGR